MKRIHKTYQSIQYPYYYTNVVIDGKIIRIGFESVSKRGSYYIYGKYGTSDPRIQRGLESSPAFNVRYRLIDEKEFNDGEAETKTSTSQDNSQQSLGEDSTGQSVLEVAKVQEARDWLVKYVPGVTYSQVRNRELALKVAKEHKIAFPNLK